MKIKDIQLFPIQMPQTYETHWANGRISLAKHIVVKVIAEDGTYGAVSYTHLTLPTNSRV